MNLGLALGLPPAIAITPGFTSLLSVLLYMFIKSEGITGVPGITGPPLPARVIMGVIALLLNANVVLVLVTGGLTAAGQCKLAVVYVLSCSVPHALAAKARAGGWMAPAIAA